MFNVIPPKASTVAITASKFTVTYSVIFKSNASFRDFSVF